MSTRYTKIFGLYLRCLLHKVKVTFMFILKNYWATNNALSSLSSLGDTRASYYWGVYRHVQGIKLHKPRRAFNAVYFDCFEQISSGMSVVTSRKINKRKEVTIFWGEQKVVADEIMFHFIAWYETGNEFITRNSMVWLLRRVVAILFLCISSPNRNFIESCHHYTYGVSISIQATKLIVCLLDQVVSMLIWIK